MFERLLVMHLKSKEGVTHFKRWALLQTRYGNLYIHKICKSDADKHPHNHPWDFWSLILKGGYWECLWTDTGVVFAEKFTWGSLIKRHCGCYHKIKLLDEAKPTWTLVWVGPRINDPWGYLVDGTWVRHDFYRELKNKNLL